MTTEQAELNPNGLTSAQQGSIIPLGWKPTAAEPVPVVRCSQIKKDGTRCKRWSIRGYLKCYRHAGPGAMKGGNVQKYAEAVIEAARLRLVDSADEALEVLLELSQPGTSEGIRLKAATEVLDRAGIRGGFDVKVDQTITVNPSETVKERLAQLAEGARAVEKMRAESRERLGLDDPDTDTVDAEIISDPEEQGTLFDV